MAITSAAKKALRQNVRHRAKNLVYKNKIKNLFKEVRSFILQKKIKEAETLLPQIYKALDKAAKVGVIKKNAASRSKSRIAKLIAKSR
ncbi:MAG: 30S ribosomal protein S20 [Candidatus Nealsonbacteria bacterium]|nr:30S ribosomal protein S20 [Candidatus Nealsonbacteria bacterium]